MIQRLWSAIAAARAVIIAVSATAAVIGPASYLAGRTHAADKAQADQVRQVTEALSAERELVQRREQVIGRWAIEGLRLTARRATEDRSEAGRLEALGDQARDTASDPLRADWPLADQRRLACVLDPACDPAASRDAAGP